MIKATLAFRTGIVNNKLTVLGGEVERAFALEILSVDFRSI